MMTYVFVHGPVFIRTAQSHQLAGFPQRAALWDGPYGDMIHVAAACEPLHIQIGPALVLVDFLLFHEVAQGALEGGFAQAEFGFDDGR